MGYTQLMLGVCELASQWSGTKGYTQQLGGTLTCFPVWEKPQDWLAGWRPQPDRIPIELSGQTWPTAWLYRGAELLVAISAPALLQTENADCPELSTSSVSPDPLLCVLSDPQWLSQQSASVDTGTLTRVGLLGSIP